jgi:transcriptional regulator with XRE-family HTH domain
VSSIDGNKLGLGKRIKALRKQASLNQQKLAELLGVFRTTVTQIENGTRKVTSDELLKLSKIFNISVDMLLDSRKETEVILQKTKGEEKIRPQLRINVPQKNLTKFKEVLLYILNKVGSKPNIGETVVYKLLYFIDFNFYEKYEEQLIGATYIKNHHGPTPIEFKKILEKAIENEEITRVKSQYFHYPQTKYLPLRKPDLTKLKAHEIEVIDEVLCKLSEMNAVQISEYSHNDVPWLTTEDGHVIEYETVFYRTPPYSAREYSENIS